MSPNRMAVLACRLHEAQQVHRRELALDPGCQTLYLDCLPRAPRLAARLAKARDHQWYGAARRLRTQLERTVDEAARQVDIWKRHLQRYQPPVQPVRLLHAELRQLEDEFGELRFIAETYELAVCTDRIVLEYVDLGPFEIRLSLRPPAPYQTAYPAFRVLALTPNPADGQREIPHPHVNGTQLCTGDGSYTIREALMAGRICDFFLIVRSILQTYNPESAYIQLADWEGISCSDCGERGDPDDRSYCQSCDDPLCDCCVRCCCYCEDSFCAWHVGPCRDCEEPYCDRCREDLFVDGRCCDCREQDEDDPSDTTTERETSHVA